VKKKANRKSGSVKSVKNLPAKTVKAKTAKNVKGGKESVSLDYGTVKWVYKPQNSAG